MSLENPHIIRQLKPLEDIIQQRRVHPARAAKAHLSGTTLSTALCPFDAKSTPNSSRELTDEERENELGLDAIVSDWMIQGANNMRKHRPPFGLVYSDSKSYADLSDKNMKIIQNPRLVGDPFSTFSFSMYHTLADSLKEKLKQIFSAPEGNEAEKYRTYLEFVHRNGPRPDDPYAIMHTVSTTNTALHLMGDILAHIPDIDSTPLKRKPTIDESVNAARNSTPLILKLSSFEQKVFDVIYRSMAGDEGIWKSLEIVENGGKMYYQIKDPVLQQAKNQLSHPATKEELENRRRGGCPARMGAIQTLWNWYIDYSVQVSNQTPTISR